MSSLLGAIAPTMIYKKKEKINPVASERNT
jgi:hypothetical protein